MFEKIHKPKSYTPLVLSNTLNITKNYNKIVNSPLTVESDRIGTAVNHVISM